MKWALVNTQNIVHNVIEYDEEIPYTPPSWLSIEQINDWVNIGDDKNIPEPVTDKESHG